MDAFLSAPTSCMIRNTQLPCKMANPNHTMVILHHNTGAHMNEYLIHYQSEDSRTH
jgi:hypothetical protein